MKKALVTGVSWDTGIGYAISKQLIEDGYFVYAIYHSKDSTAKEKLEKNYKDSNHRNVPHPESTLQIQDCRYNTHYGCISILPEHLKPHRFHHPQYR